MSSEACLHAAMTGDGNLKENGAKVGEALE